MKKDISKVSDSLGIAKPGPNDVLCGRGGLTNHHIGNLNFRKLVEYNKKLYLSCPKRHKMIVSRSIEEAIRNQTPAGRFLQFDPKKQLWFDIGPDRSLHKTSQALREGSVDVRQEMSSSKKTKSCGDTKNSRSTPLAGTKSRPVVVPDVVPSDTPPSVPSLPVCFATKWKDASCEEGEGAPKKKKFAKHTEGKLLKKRKMVHHIEKTETSLSDQLTSEECKIIGEESPGLKKPNAAQKTKTVHFVEITESSYFEDDIMQSPVPTKANAAQKMDGILAQAVVVSPAGGKTEGHNPTEPSSTQLDEWFSEMWYDENDDTSASSVHKSSTEHLPVSSKAGGLSTTTPTQKEQRSNNIDGTEDSMSVDDDRSFVNCFSEFFESSRPDESTGDGQPDKSTGDGYGRHYSIVSIDEFSACEDMSVTSSLDECDPSQNKLVVEDGSEDGSELPLGSDLLTA